MKMEHLIPISNRMEKNTFNDITEHDTHPTRKVINTGYVTTLFWLLQCGDVIHLFSDEYQIDKYYFVARDGFEEISETWLG